MNEPVRPLVRVDGTSAVVAAREGGSAVIYAMFFKWTGERWEKGKIFLEPYEELLENEDHTYDFHLDMSGQTAICWACPTPIRSTCTK